MPASASTSSLPIRPPSCARRRIWARGCAVIASWRGSPPVWSPGGLLFIASCSHNVEPPDFAEAVRHGLEDAHRTGRILRSAGAAPDHPVHPWLPESAYLKGQVLALD